MKSKFSNIEVRGMCTVLPKNEVLFDDEIDQYSFTHQQSLKLKKVFSLEKRRVAPVGTCASDLAEAGLVWLSENFPDLINSIGALIFVSQTPDYIMPPTSNILQAKMGLPNNTYCIDINQGCCGFIIGLQQAASLISTTDIRNVLVINADVLSAKVSSRDRNSNPLVGDAASVTLVSQVKNESPDSNCYFNIKMDGSSAFALHIPAGGARIPCSDATAEMINDDMGNQRSLNNLVMQGDQVFSFVQKYAPELIKETMEECSIVDSDVEKYLLHQPNKFMLQKIAESLGVKNDKVPDNIVEMYGNSSGVTIPLVISSNLKLKMLEEERHKYVLCGFGVGLTWGCMIVNLGNMLFCEQLEI